jgi:hypothetical protein
LLLKAKVDLFQKVLGIFQIIGGLASAWVLWGPSW